jgi:hypothetical protein
VSHLLIPVETSSARVLEGEQRLAGWTLLSPENPNEKISAKLEEKIVLLTPAALYLVSFNYSLDKVQGYTRVPLGSITKIEKGEPCLSKLIQGPYILSPLQEAGRDPVENAGFVIHFSRHQSRYSSYSMSNGEQDLPEDAQPEGAEYHAFKVLPREFSSALDDDLDSDAGPQETCRAVADRLVARLQEECVKVGAAPGVEERDIVRCVCQDAGYNPSRLTGAVSPRHRRRFRSCARWNTLLRERSGCSHRTFVDHPSCCLYHAV